MDGGIVDIADVSPSIDDLLAESSDPARLQDLGVRAVERPLEDVSLGPPLRPRNIFCVGWNYLKHFDEGAGRFEQELPDYPNFFSKTSGTLNGPYDDVPAHENVTTQLDYEAELAVVIGMRGKDIPEEDALAHVFGYSVANDVSARDLQKRAGVQWLKGKSLDGTCPLGPWIVTADEVGDPQILDIVSSVNDEPRQKSTTGRMVFSVARLVSLLSEGLTLAPGDVLLTGTPEGVGMGYDPPRFLAAGDVVECSIVGIGTIRNRIAERR